MYARVEHKQSYMVGGTFLRVMLAIVLVVSLFALSAVAFASPSIQNGSFVIDEWIDGDGNAILTSEQLDAAYAALQAEDPTVVDVVEVSEIPTAQQQDMLAGFMGMHPEIETVVVDVDASVPAHQAYEALAGMGFASYRVETIPVYQDAGDPSTLSAYAHVLQISQGQSGFPATLVVRVGDAVYADARQAYVATDYSQAANWPDAYVQANGDGFGSAGSVVFSYDGQGIFLDGKTIDLGSTKAGDIAWYFIENTPCADAAQSEGAASESDVVLLSFSANAADDPVADMPHAQALSGTEDEAEQPASPARDGYVFAGWYNDASGLQLWDFDSDPVETDTTLYAKWIEIAQPSSAFIPSDSHSDPSAPPPPDSTTTLSSGGGTSSDDGALAGKMHAAVASLSLMQSDLPAETGKTRMVEVAEGLQQAVEAAAGLPASEVVFDDAPAPLTALQAWCWVHVYTVVGIMVTTGFTAVLVARRWSFIRELKLMEARASIDDGLSEYPMGLAFMKDIFSEDTWSR